MLYQEIIKNLFLLPLFNYYGNITNYTVAGQNKANGQLCVPVMG